MPLPSEAMPLVSAAPLKSAILRLMMVASATVKIGLESASLSSVTRRPQAGQAIFDSMVTASAAAKDVFASVGAPRSPSA